MTTEEQRTKFTEQLTEMEDWLYMEGEAEGAVEFRARLKQVKDVGDPMKKRAQVQREVQGEVQREKWHTAMDYRCRGCS